MLNIKCRVEQPEGFVPLNDEQDIAVMAPYFEQFDTLYIKSCALGKSKAADMLKKRDIHTQLFYILPNTGKDQKKNTLAFWRYKNSACFQSFHIWLLGQKHHQAEIVHLHAHYQDLQAKVDALGRIFSTELYRHHSGTVYQLLIVGNSSATRADYPEQCTYMNIYTKEVFTRPLKEFLAKNARIDSPII